MVKRWEQEKNGTRYSIFPPTLFDHEAFGELPLSLGKHPVGVHVGALARRAVLVDDCDLMPFELDVDVLLLPRRMRSSTRTLHLQSPGPSLMRFWYRFENDNAQLRFGNSG
jgi:hypothetical protein